MIYTPPTCLWIKTCWLHDVLTTDMYVRVYRLPGTTYQYLCTNARLLLDFMAEHQQLINCRPASSRMSVKTNTTGKPKPWAPLWHCCHNENHFTALNARPGRRGCSWNCWLVLLFSTLAASTNPRPSPRLRPHKRNHLSLTCIRYGTLSIESL